MPRLVILVAVLVGIGAGFGLTALAIGSGARLFVETVGGWEFSPRIGAGDIDPFTRARLFAEGEFPLAAGEGYRLRTRVDHDGQPLLGTCRYRLTGPMPAARFWTITLSDTAGKLVPNLAGRSGFTSAEIVRRSDGAFAIEIGAAPLSGNWLPSGTRGSAPFELTLRLYETPLSATATRLDPRSLPTLTRIACPS